MNISVCIDAVYMGVEPEQAIREVKKEGIPAIEFWSWWDKDLGRLKNAVKETGLAVAAFCTEFISLVDASRREEYIEALRKTIGVAKELGCKTIITQTGAELLVPREEQHKNLIQGLKECVPYLTEADMTLVVEPLNIRVDHAGYYLSSSDEAAEIIKEVADSHVKMLFDIYHQQITEGDLIRRIKEYMPYIGHFHAAGNPGRHELYNSEIDYGKVFSVIAASGYKGYTGLEYFPEDVPQKGLEYVKKVAGCEK